VGLNAVIDINHASRVVDFASARQSSRILGVIHKCTEGVGWSDPAYNSRRDGAEGAGLLWGAYHFGTAQYPGDVQARAFLAAARPGPDTLLALDLELNERAPGNSMTIDQAEVFVRTVYDLTGRLPLLYTHPAWADGEKMGKAGRSLGGAVMPGTVLAACDLWLADYRNWPELPSAWAVKGWHLWQYAGDGEYGRKSPFGAHVRGVQGIERCDRNLSVAADEMALRRWWTRGSLA
jgi:lysozyme